jgi:hypothetical protein
MKKINILIDDQEILASECIFVSEFQDLYVDYVQRIGGNNGLGFIGKLAWDASHKKAFRSALNKAGVMVQSDPPEILPGFELGLDGRIVRINRGKFP